MFYFKIMDSLTQIVLGAAVGNAVAGRKLKNRAVLYGAIVGTIPDLDVLIGLFLDPVRAVEIHRGMSHSVLFAVVMGVMLGWCISKWERRSNLSFKEGFWLVFLGLFTHAVLDVFTTWGTRVLWPFSNYPFAFKSIFVVDPLYTVPFLVCLLISIGYRYDLNKRMSWNRKGLVISSSYLALTLVLKGVAYDRFQTALRVQQLDYEQLSVKPSVMNTVLWNAIVDAPDAYLLGDYSFLDTSDVVFRSYAKNYQLGGALEGVDVLNRLIRLSEGWYTFSEKDGELYFNDLRFGLLKSEQDDVQFAFSYRLYQDDSGVWVAEEVEKERKDGVQLLRDLWIRLQGR